MAQHDKIKAIPRDRFFRVGRMLLYNLQINTFLLLERYVVPIDEPKNVR